MTRYYLDDADPVLEGPDSALENPVTVQSEFEVHPLLPLMAAQMPRCGAETDIRSPLDEAEGVTPDFLRID
jgi:hypothetical protein